MDHHAFVEQYEVQGLKIQAEAVEQDGWFLHAIDRTGAVVASLPVSKEAVQELYAAQRIERRLESEEIT